jgi:hypothetical protein
MKSDNNAGNDLLTTSSKINEKPKLKEKVNVVKERPKQTIKRKSNDEEVLKKKEKEVKYKNEKRSVNIEDSSCVTIRKKRRKLTEVLRQEAREQVFHGSNDADRFLVFQFLF